MVGVEPAIDLSVQDGGGLNRNKSVRLAVLGSALGAVRRRAHM